MPMASAAPPLASCSEPSPSPFSLTQEVADALYWAAEAKQAVLDAQANLQSATDTLDQMVEIGALPEKNLPTVSGFAIYRQEGRVSWSYPPAIKALEAQVKQQKQLCEQLGEAIQKRGNPFWTIKPFDASKP
ncbi:hypothetical protein [Synechococcus sp. SynAce01]|uniref:hypothetical protein n=2 Tax=unclassified Synechococcus TaxID=2626047 RepID=UPI0013C49F18|nr:hypothetical protein [Synechococcus sp. SynAce01]